MHPVGVAYTWGTQVVCVAVKVVGIALRVPERCEWCEWLESVASLIKYLCCSHNLVSRSRETYNALTNWLTDARMLASQNIVIILCGNKKDLDADREVTFLEASRFAQENGKWPFACHTCWGFQMQL